MHLEGRGTPEAITPPKEQTRPSQAPLLVKERGSKDGSEKTMTLQEAMEKLPEKKEPTNRHDQIREREQRNSAVRLCGQDISKGQPINGYYLQFLSKEDREGIKRDGNQHMRQMVHDEHQKNQQRERTTGRDLA